MFKPAVKTGAKGRIVLYGPTGSGKTWTALEFANVLGNKVAVIDTERGSASKYSDQFKFDVVELDNHNPENYIRAIKEADKAGYDVLIIDSLSHAWMGNDGALALVDKAAKKSQSNNTYVAWRDVTPLHNQLVDAILASKCHVIATMRAKMDYVLEENDRGKKVPKKIGLAPIQREGMEYEFDLVVDMTVEHDAIVGKTRCSALDGVIQHKPKREFLAPFVKWLDGVPKKEAPAPDPKSNDATAAEGTTQSTASAPTVEADAAPASTEQAPDESENKTATVGKEQMQQLLEVGEKQNGWPRKRINELLAKNGAEGKNIPWKAWEATLKTVSVKYEEEVHG